MGRSSAVRKLFTRPAGLWLSRAPRPYVAFAVTSYREARRLYRAQNIIWVWLGLAAALSSLAWLVRPSLGVVLVSHSGFVDAARNALFCYGGLLISGGVWWIRRELEVFGHILFASGALLNAIVAMTLPGPQFLTVTTTAGVAIASGLRAFYLVRWIGAVAPGSADAPPS